MPFIKVPKLSGSHPLVLLNAAVVRLHWNFNGHLGFNVLGADGGGTFANSQTHANNLATAVAGRFTSSGLKALTHSSTSLVAVGIRDISDANLAEFVGNAGPIAGTGAGDPLPS